MKKLLTFSILTYLLFTINSSAVNQSLNENNLENEKILKVGVLLPLSGEFQDIGESFLKAIQLALYDISNENIKIYPKDSKANAMNTYYAAKEFQELGVEVYGLSTQTTDYQKEMVDRLSLPFNVLSDSQMELTQAINLPTFVVTGMVLLKRLTMVVDDSMIKSVHYPVFPSDSDPDWVLDYFGKMST